MRAVLSSIKGTIEQPAFTRADSAVQKALDFDGYLGTLPLPRQAPYNQPSSDPQIFTDSNGVQFDSDGVVVNPEIDHSFESMNLAFRRRNIARHLLKEDRVGWCGRRFIVKDDEKPLNLVLSRKHKKARIEGLMSCGSLWACPVCAKKISQRRAKMEILPVMKAHESVGGRCLLVSFTAPHTLEYSCKEFTDKIIKALSWFYENATFKRPEKGIRDRHGWVGRVRSLETLHGLINGWHSHFHEIWFMDAEFEDCQRAWLQEEIYKLWAKACKRVGLGEPSRKHGVDVRDGKAAGKYISKLGTEDKLNTWGLQDEVAKGHLKNGKNGSRSPFQLLDAFADGDKQAGALYVEFVNAFRNKRHITWSKGMRKLYDVNEFTDQELMDIKEDEGDSVRAFTLYESKLLIWTKKGSYDSNMPILKALAENGGLEAVEVFIQGLKDDDFKNGSPIKNSIKPFEPKPEPIIERASDSFIENVLMKNQHLEPIQESLL